jgi:putative CocE/NonD family hydrolase
VFRERPAVRISRNLTAVAVTALLAAGLGSVSGAARASTSYSVTTLHFKVLVAGGTQTCDIVGDLYQPATATAAQPAPAILTTNGFGGSKDDQAPLAKLFAADGYVVLSYSGLGFGGSTCKITLDDPDVDGAAGKQLVSYLGGAPGIAYTDAEHTTEAPQLRVVKKDAPGDPRVGMFGGSYGGEIQFAVASIDRRVDTIVPVITWNDLSYSLGPNNSGPTINDPATPGTTKLAWGLGFSGLGMVDGLQGAQDDPSRMVPCPNFADFVCPALVTAGTLGWFQPDTIATFKHASVASYMSRIRIPTLLMQGENDTLFNLNEAIANYRALKAQGTPVKMIWHSWGHSGDPVPGDIDLGNPDVTAQYETGRVKDWFDHYLKGTSVGTGPAFAYFRDWVPFTGNARPAYATSSSYPVGSAKTYRLSGTDALTTGTPATGSQSFVTPPAGAPSSINPTDALGFVVDGGAGDDTNDVPGTFAQWTSAALTKNVDVAGTPVARLTVSAPTAAATQLTGPAGQLVLFVKVEDVGTDGKAHLVHGLEAPVRIADVTKPVTVTLPAIVHRFAVGHSIRLVVAGGSVNYRGGVTPTAVTIGSGPGQTLTLPSIS